MTSKVDRESGIDPIETSIKTAQTFLSKSQVSEVYDMLNALAGVCDNAKSKDGEGFSKADLIGHYIVELPPQHFDKDWSVISLLLVKKYQRQLVRFGFDPSPYIEILDSKNKSNVDHIRTNRANRQKRRVLLTNDGDFEIYFPNKSSLRGFDTNLLLIHEWITENDIPHGYSFTVKRGARAFVQSTVEQFVNWFIPEDTKALLDNENIDSIDVSDAVTHDLYILGDSLDKTLTFKWDNIYQFLDLVKSFSRRSFGGGKWEVNIKSPSDLELLVDLVSREDCKIYISKELRNELVDIESKKESLRIAEEKAALEREKEAYKNRPRCVVCLSTDRITLSFTKFDYSFVNWIKDNLSQKSFNNGLSPYWSASINENNIIKLYSMLDNDDWEFNNKTRSFIESSYIEAVTAIEKRRLQKETALRISSQKLADEEFSFDESIINGELLPFQRVVLQYNDIHKNMLIGDDMGLGKTLTSLACAAKNSLHDSVNISCPAIARLTWRNEINKWLPDASIYICKKANSKKVAAREEEAILSADFVITSYNKMSVYQEILSKRSAKLFIGDESQYLKNPKSQRTKASMTVSKTCNFVYLLSGTPLKNRPIELITQLKMLNVLDKEFEGEGSFLFRYCGPTNNGYGYSFNGSSNLGELRQKLRETCMVRRLKDEVMEFLPEKRRMRIPVEIPNRKEYDKANKDFFNSLINKVTERAKVEAKQANLKGSKKTDFINSMVNEKREAATRAEMFVHIGLLRKVVARGLQDAAYEWIKDFCSDGEQLVVFAYHQDQQKYLYNQLSENTNLRVGKIVTGMTDENRKQVELDFQNKKYDVVICSIMSANTNITLTASTTVLTVEYIWVPGDHIQAEDRCRRIGTSIDADSINCYYLHAEDTVDDLFWKTIVTKFEVIEQSMDKDEGDGFENLNEDVKTSIINGMMEQFDFIIDKKAA